MRTRTKIEDSLLTHARAVSGLRGDGPLLHAALHALIQRECSERLASLIGAQRDWKLGVHRPDFDL